MDEAPRKRPGPKKGDPRSIEAGRQGAALVRRDLGDDFFRAIGAKGGATTAERHGREHFSNIGRVGGSRRRNADPTPNDATA